MNKVQSEHSHDMLDGVLQLRFADRDGVVKDLVAAEMVEVLQGIIEFTSDLAKQGQFGDGPEPEVRVRPTKEGSVIVETVFSWLGQNPEVAFGMALTAGGAISQALGVGLRKLRGQEPTDFEELGDGSIKIKWPDSTVNHVSRQTWNRLNKMPRPTRAALRKLLSPLGDDVDELEIRDGKMSDETGELLQSKPAVTAGRSDYQAAAPRADEEVVEDREFETEARLQSIDFRPGERWRIQTVTGQRMASMKDSEFLLEVDRGMPLHKNDIFQLTIQEVRTTRNGRTSTDWSIIKVLRKRRGEDDGPTAELPADK